MDPLAAAKKHFDETLNLINRLNDDLLAKINAPLGESEKYASVDALRERLSHKADGMAELLLKMNAITEAELYELAAKVWAWKDHPSAPRL